MKNIVRAFVLVLAATGYVSFAHNSAPQHGLTASSSMVPMPVPKPTPQF